MPLHAIAVCLSVVTLSVPGAALGFKGGPMKLRAADIVGTWYEIARFPEHFGRDCTRNRAINTLDGDNITTQSVCNKGGKAGPEKRFRLSCAVINNPTETRLKFSYKIFSREVVVEEVGDSGEYAALGTDDRAHLFIIHRAPVMEEATLAGLKDRMKLRGYDTSRLVRVEQ